MAEILMPQYPKINGVYKRHTEGPQKGSFIWEDWADPAFGFLVDNRWVWKEKIDGTNIRLGNVPEIPRSKATVPQLIAGRTNKADIPRPLYAVLEDLMMTMPFGDLPFGDKPFTLYGEGYGAGIQKGGGYRSDPSFILFDVRIHDHWLPPEDVDAVAAVLNIDSVPILAECSLREGMHRIQNREWKSSWPGHELEGVVGRPKVPLRNQWGEMVTTKLKTVDFR